MFDIVMNRLHWTRVDRPELKGSRLLVWAIPLWSGEGERALQNPKALVMLTILFTQSLVLVDNDKH